MTVTHIFCILFWLFIIFSFQPGFILCSQMTCNLMKSSEEIFLDDIRTKVTLKNTLRFIKRTKRTSKLLSPIYFHLLLCALEPLTFRIYQLIDFGFSQSPHHVLQKFESSALAFVCFEISTLLKLEISSFRRVESFKL